jgi:hypothetical protein
MRRASARLLAIAAVLLPISFAQAAWIDLGGATGARVLEDTPGRISVEFRVGGFERSDVVIDGRAWSEVRLPEEGILLEAGLPELPLMARSVIVPNDRRM